MKHHKTIRAMALVATLILAAPPAIAAWIPDGVPLCTALDDQDYPRITPDGAGGQIVVWRDMRGPNNDVYAQRIGANGTVLWTLDGASISSTGGITGPPLITTDDAGGAIIVWNDSRAGTYDIYAQRIDALGTVLWTVDGIPICMAIGHQNSPRIVPDGSGGAVIAWMDQRNGGYDIYAQRVDSAGSIQWVADGVPACAAVGDQRYVEMAPDGAGGAIIVWVDERTGQQDVYAQRIDQAGSVRWTVDGEAICTASADQFYPHVVADDAGGAILAWHDQRSGNYDVYAQWVDQDGAIQWTANGEPLCALAGGQLLVRLAPDGLGGAIVTWMDSRSGLSDIYAQRINGPGGPQWTPNGVALCTAAGVQQYPDIAADGLGGAVVAWEDMRGGSLGDVYAQRVDASGSIHWGIDGVEVCAASGDEQYPRIASDGAGSALVAWFDDRGGDDDIYAQRVYADGTVVPVGPQILGYDSTNWTPEDDEPWSYTFQVQDEGTITSAVMHYRVVADGDQWITIDGTIGKAEKGIYPVGFAGSSAGKPSRVEWRVEVTNNSGIPAEDQADFYAGTLAALDIQEVDPCQEDQSSPLAGQPVNLNATVMAVEPGRLVLFCGDPAAKGIYPVGFAGASAGKPSSIEWAAGDSIRIGGRILEIDGMTTIVPYADGAFTSLGAAIDPPLPPEVDTRTLADDDLDTDCIRGEQYESCWVKTPPSAVVDVSSFAADRTFLISSTGLVEDALRVRLNDGITYEPAMDHWLRVTGATAQTLAGYELRPATDDDIQLANPRILGYDSTNWTPEDDEPWSYTFQVQDEGTITSAVMHYRVVADGDQWITIDGTIGKAEKGIYPVGFAGSSAGKPSRVEWRVEVTNNSGIPAEDQADFYAGTLAALDIQEVDPCQEDQSSPLAGQPVNLNATVMAVEPGRLVLFCGDPAAKGIYPVGFAGASAGKPSSIEWAAGDSIRIGGRILEIDGMTTIVPYADGAFTSLGAAIDPPLPPEVDTRTLADDDLDTDCIRGEQYESCWVKTPPSAVVDVSSFAADRTFLISSTGLVEDALRVRLNDGITYEPAMDHWLRVTGATAQTLAGYELRPATDDDIQLEQEVAMDPWLPAMEPIDYVQCSPGMRLSPEEMLTIYAWPSGPDLPGDPADQGWTSQDLTGAGDYAWIWDQLEDGPASGSNLTPQFAFIDDGVKVPGTGGSLCETWCYGPNLFVLNTDFPGGRPSYLHNEVWSPEIEWPTGNFDGAVLSFEVFRHERMTAEDGSPGVFYLWRVRSAIMTGSGEEWSDWRDRGFAYYGDAGHRRVKLDVSDLLLQDRIKVQISLGVVHLGWSIGLTGHDATPAPYFDNVDLKVYEHTGPAIYARAIDLAQDAFADPEGNVRIDAALNTSPPEHMMNTPADSITVQVRPIGPGAELSGPPVLHYHLRANQAMGGSDQVGSVTGIQETKASGALVDDLWTFSLPDESFMAAGDVLHYYIEAGQEVLGSPAGVSTLPADLSGYDLFPGDPLYRWAADYPDLFTMVGLPTIKSEIPGDHPPVLVWLDLRGSGNDADWATAFDQGGFVRGVDFDVYYTNGPSFGVGNGLGGRATASDLAGYETILYDCGNLHLHTLSNGDFDLDPSNDIALLDQWLNQGNKNLLLTGDHLADDLWRSPAGAAFAVNWVGIDLVSHDVTPLVQGQTSPLAVAMPGNPVFDECFQWRAFRHWTADLESAENYTFDAVTARIGTQVLMEYYDPACQDGRYPYAAATLNENPAGLQNKIIYLPYSYTHLMSQYDDSNSCDCDKAQKIGPRGKGAGLIDILVWFGSSGSGLPVPVPKIPGVFGASCHPNPFNPRTTISYNLPEAGDLRIRIYNLRGELVASLVDGPHPAGAGNVVWGGTNAAGARVASGVYFYEVRHGGEVIRDKIMLVK